ncbi:MAG: GNAT family N-acetyltransferase [Roseinatronobacter sp.]
MDISLTQDLATCHALRRVVFIEEQRVPEEIEIDDQDADALHVLARLDGRPVGCARLLLLEDTGKIGRVCVLQDMRGQGVGVALIRAALDVLRAQPGVTCAKLGAQTHAIGFYEKLGFLPHGQTYLEAGIPHQDMILDFPVSS